MVQDPELEFLIEAESIKEKVQNLFLELVNLLQELGLIQSTEEYS